jgi:hypothetical protein
MIVSDIIIWSSPAVFGLALYLAHDAFAGIKEDLKDLKDRQLKTRDDLADLKIQTMGLAGSIMSSHENLKSLTDSVKSVDHKMGKVESFESHLGLVNDRLAKTEENNGRIIMVMNKIISIVMPKTPK